jgi:hypothetical protein
VRQKNIERELENILLNLEKKLQIENIKMREGKANIGGI